MSSESGKSTKSTMDLDTAFKYVRIVERGLARLGMREGDNTEDLRFHECYETIKLYELVSKGGLRDLQNFIKKLENEEEK